MIAQVFWVEGVTGVKVLSAVLKNSICTWQVDPPCSKYQNNSTFQFINSASELSKHNNSFILFLQMNSTTFSFLISVLLFNPHPKDDASGFTATWETLDNLIDQQNTMHP